MIELLITNFDPNEMIETMVRDGAVSVPLIPGDFLQALLRQAEGYEFRKSERLDTQLISSVYGPAKDLQVQLEFLFNDRLRSLRPEILDEELRFNSATINRLLPYGRVRAHTDYGFKGTVCVCVLNEGRNFYVSPSTHWQDFMSTRKKIASNPGDVIFIRGIGFLGLDSPVYHEVTRRRTEGDSYALVFRQQIK